MINRTPQPINTLSIRYGEEKTFGRLNLSSTLPAYSQAKFQSSTHSLVNLAHENQLKLFDPTVQISGLTPDCADKTKACYNDPYDYERVFYENIMINMRNSFNRKSFQSYIENYFADASVCANYSGCVDYKDPALSYATRNMMMMGISGHQMDMFVMRDVYAADGMGGGSLPDIGLHQSEGKGWASYWHAYMDPNSGSYRGYNNMSYLSVFHEIAHGYGFNHSSGMTYGFADSWTNTYLQQHFTQHERENSNAHQVPSVLTKAELLEERKVRLSFYHTQPGASAQDIELQFIHNDGIDIKVDYIEGRDNTSVDVTFGTPPVAPVYVRSVSGNGEYMSTLQFKGSDLIPLPRYTFGGKAYTILDKKLIAPETSGWGIRKLCDQPGQQLATKADYQALWNYMSANNLLGTLSTNKFLSRDEPASWYIWMLEFNAREMASSYYQLGVGIGNDKALVCVAPAN
ncbi:hypothetical protein VV869_05700 [Photobacterium sp. MCCC 1A19761]|uniref:hypothetical protein n=1 Tax=Photobacterium sp. MCCC 1A19761 TaxID=3115000 RepID=UPI00307E78C3